MCSSQYYYYFDLPKIRVGRVRTTKKYVAFALCQNEQISAVSDIPSNEKFITMFCF